MWIYTLGMASVFVKQENKAFKLNEVTVCVFHFAPCFSIQQIKNRETGTILFSFILCFSLIFTSITVRSVKFLSISCVCIYSFVVTLRTERRRHGTKVEN